MTDDLKRTPLYDRHISLGARMVPFAGWEMPVQYSEGIIAEHNHTRAGVSVFDICHMGEFRIKGHGAAEVLDRILARSVIDQKPGVCRYNFILNESGMVIDDLIVYRVGEHEFFIVVNAGTKDGDAEHFKSQLPVGIEFFDESDITAKIDLQGPGSADVLIDRFGFDAEALPGYFRFIETEIDSVPCILSRTGYTGELGFEIYIDTRDAGKVWDSLLAADAVKPAGLGARDTLRLEMGYALYGHELNLETTPLEAGFAQMLNLSSGREFIGSKALAAAELRKNLVPVELEGRRAAREGAKVFFEGTEAGLVSSGAFSPSLGKAVALVYLNAQFASEPGTELMLEAGRSQVKGVVAELPFYKEGSVRKKF